MTSSIEARTMRDEIADPAQAQREGRHDEMGHLIDDSRLALPAPITGSQPSSMAKNRIT